MSIESNLYTAQAALAALGHIARYYINTGIIPPEDFGFGLSVILGHIEDDIRTAYSEYVKPEENPE
jgi:hypothetical protein